jgi:hypothetical protein
MQVSNTESHQTPFTVPATQEGSRYKLPEPGGPEGGHGPKYVGYYFDVCTVHLVQFIIQANTRTTNILTIFYIS